MKLIVINGPNMNMLSVREPDKYGTLSLDDICSEIEKTAILLGINVDFFQSNVEGEIINAIHNAYEVYDGIIINPAAFSHYSIAILDALKAVNIPAIEVHMTNIFAREGFRNNTVTSGGCIGMIAGFGKDVYSLAVRALSTYIENRK